MSGIDDIDRTEVDTLQPEQPEDLAEKSGLERLREINRGLADNVRLLVQRKRIANVLETSPSLSDYPLQKRFTAIAQAICEVLPDIFPEDVIFRSVPSKLKAKGAGDYSIDIPKLKESNPNEEKGASITRFRTEVIPKLMQSLPSRLPFIREFKQAGIFLNFTLDSPTLRKDILDSVDTMGDRFGDSDIFKGESFVLDYSSPNMGKPMHIGHLRTTVIGQALSNLLNRTGAIVYAVNHIGDWGTIFGHLTTAYNHWGEEIAKEISPDENPIDFLSALYVRVRQEIKKEQMATGSSPIEEEGRQNFALLEAGDARIVELWEKINQWSMVELKRVYDRLGIEFDAFLGESFYEEGMDEMVQAAQDAGIVKVGLDRKSLVLDFGEREDADPDGPSLEELEIEIRDLYDRIEAIRAISAEHDEIPELEEKMKRLDNQAKERRVLPLCMLRKANGGSVYLTRDITAIRQRRREFNADHIIYIVGAEQKLHMREIFETAKRIGDIEGGECEHVAFGLIKKPDGNKISSREGAGGLLDLLDKLQAIVIQQINTPEKREDISEVQMREIADMIAKGALTYANFTQDREKGMVFDPDKMFSLNGQTGPYLQYTAVRLESLLEKSGTSDMDGELKAEDFATLNQRAIEIIEAIGEFPEVIESSARKSAPHFLATYLYNLASRFNTFYGVSVKDLGRITELKGSEKAAYIRIISATNQVLRKGLALLNIEVPLKM